MNKKLLSCFAISLSLLITITTRSYASEPAPSIFTKAQQDAITPNGALELLKQGNLRFRTDQTIHWNHPVQVAESASMGQHPFAAVVSCVDSRIPPEAVFDRGIGDLFVARVAGNFVNVDILGSLEFAFLSGTKLIVVLGHSSCGAVHGACNGGTSGLLKKALTNISPAVKSILPKSCAGNDHAAAALVQEVAEANVELNMKKLCKKSKHLRKDIDSGKYGLIGAMYDITTGEVTFTTDSVVTCKSLK
ncbi:MAG: carbonic anhydrase [Alteromonadaceae bacterium]|nr:MAG: carbonic anhydrase [Alteromonadaceae bacterium]